MSRTVASTPHPQAVPLIPAVLFLSSMLFPALVTVTKEGLFRKAEANLGMALDIFIVNTMASVSQMVCTLCALPLLARLQHVDNLGAYIVDGMWWSVFPHMGTVVDGYPMLLGQHAGWNIFMGGQQGAPLIPLLYVISNLVFNGKFVFG